MAFPMKKKEIPDNWEVNQFCHDSHSMLRWTIGPTFVRHMGHHLVSRFHQNHRWMFGLFGPAFWQETRGQPPLKSEPRKSAKIKQP